MKPRLTLPSFRRVYVTRAEELTEPLRELRSQDAIGVDVEMGQSATRLPGGLSEWKHSLSLIQIAGGGLSVVVDALRCPTAPLGGLMRSDTRKVFLGGGQDASLLEAAGIGPRHVADVGEIALALFGRRQDGMAALSDRIFGLSLDKTIRRADWTKRPLDPVLLAYAHRDAELTLMIYRWFAREHPDAVAMHERLRLEPPLPETAPDWLVEIFGRPDADATAVVMELGIDLPADAERLAGEMRPTLAGAASPRQQNRMLRVASDLGLRTLLPEVLPLAESRSSLLRSAAARAIGRLATREEGEQVLSRLADDEIEDVRKAAQVGLKELRMPRLETPPEEAGAAVPSLDNSALDALAELKSRLETGG